MARSRLSLKRTFVLSILIVLSLFAAAARAQDDDTTTTTQDTQAATTTTDDADAATTTTTSADADTDSTTATATTTSMPKITSTGTDSATTATGSTSLPRISGSTTASSDTSKLSLPTLSKTTDTSVPTYPAPSVPPTENAPYMHQSTLPDGTVFIAVGSILGAFGAAVLIWRMVVACLLHRSVKRAAMAQHLANDKTPFPAPPAPFYKYTDRDSSPSLAVAGSGRGVRRTQRGPIPSATPSQTNLFFSPTAPGATGGMGGNNRESRFLPSGFYAATSSPAPHAQGPSISMTNLRPDSRGHARAVGPSPPDSPSLAPSRGPVPRNNLSTSSVNLHRPPSGRAPSAFLDDLLDEQPGMFPSAGSGPAHPGYGPQPPQPNQGRF
ncbi:Vacuolar membrane protein [Pleurostoma richardsiae]|uniref:Vacuolar membrane protein n=1 Tax=Pleurostoma richardsiae TaxID=41990 RepID=A0AA38RWK2_9PEZI|nr:Vacuolar membrane protein [Pleurostoma richardsiae]